jgi:hypothetical protein
MSTHARRFQIHRPQKIAATLLLIFLLQSLWLLAHLPLDMAETRATLAGRALWSNRQLLGASSPLIAGDSVLSLRSAGILAVLAKYWDAQNFEFSIYAAPNRWLVRLPFACFGLWLGGALWWVSRRLYGDEGGYIALALYAFSPPMLLASATVAPSILAAWGLFGLIFTAIGVAHTLYAPPKRWRPRILLLGVAIGVTAGANLSAAIAGLIFAIAFMLYLAPGRRFASVCILLVSSAIAALLFFSFFGFDLRDLSAAALAPNVEYLHLTWHRVAELLLVPGGLLEIVAFVCAVLVFLVWKRTRYFGNVAPLLVAVLLPWWPGRFLPGTSAIWALPFAFVFIGGIYADLLEPSFFRGKFRSLVVTTAFVLVGANAVLSLTLLARA